MVDSGSAEASASGSGDGIAVWAILDGVLCLTCPDGSTSVPKALDVLKAELKGLREIGPLRFTATPSAELPRLRFSRFPLAVRIEVTAPHEGNGFKSEWRIEAGSGRSAVSVTLADLARGHVIAGDAWYPLESGDAEEVAAIVGRCGMSEGEPVSLGCYLKLVGSDETPVMKLHSPQDGAIGAAVVEGGDWKAIGLNAELYPYQTSGFNWLTGIASESLGGILGDEMGLGKTLQVIALFLAEITEGRRQHLVVAPVTLLENWKRELRKFAPAIQPIIHQGKDRTGFPKELLSADVVLTSYETVARDLGLFEMIDWGVVVLDEAQAIKNPQAQRTLAVKRLKRRVGFAVTGTPVENRLRDLWSLIDFAVPNHLGTEAEFVRHFEDSVADAVALEPLVTPLLLRRRVAEVAKDLPPRIDIPQFLTLSEEEAGLYEAIRTRTIAEFGNAAALVNLTRLRMFCSHPNLSEEGKALHPLDSVKLTRLLEILEEVFESGEKALVFTSYTEIADLICRTIRSELKVGADTLDGRRPVTDRQPLIDRFSAGNDLRCLVLNPKAAGAGLNITAANHVIHYNPEWNPATEDQATARSFRRGQTKPVTVHRLIFAGTVEEAILDRLERKRELADAAVVGGSGDELDRGDIMRALQMSPLGK